jgi:hypothetical protein
MTGCFNGIFLALTPVERWQAARRFNSNFVTERWFILIGAIVLVTLTVTLLLVSLKRNKQERKSSEQLFIEHADKRGLTVHERQILLEAARKAGLKRSEFIFTLKAAFDWGTAKMIEESLVDQPDTEGRKQLKTELFMLREKLGFMNYSSSGSRAHSTNLSSRQIPVDKKILITRRKARDSGDIEPTVIRNTDTELAVRLAKPIKIIFGELWCARYYFGSSIWEFDTSVVSYDGDILVLKHSDNIRFINRRRFLRVPVNMPAFIAPFPFEKSLIKSGYSSKTKPAADHDLAKTFAATWGPPDFVPATVTELAGPGLRIESSLKVEIGERILVVFDLTPEQDPISTKRSIKAATSKIVEGIGEVRHTKQTKNGLSIAIELTGLSDSNIDELIRATNAALLNVSDRNNNASTPGDAVEPVPAHMGV